jgi:glutathione synthase/RimK-type ligase-like ATP-grasp enzyme
VLPNISLIIQACDQLGLKYEFRDKNKNLLNVFLQNKHVTFLNSSTSFNNETVAKICKDKSFTYQLLNKFVSMPRTLDFLDPEVPAEFKNYVLQKNNTEVAQNILSNFSFPIILKPNQKSHGTNVFKCNNAKEVLAAVNTIFDKKTIDYDYLLLAQECIQSKQEFRVITFKGNVELVYLKDISEAKFSGNLSPLHWEGAKAKYIQDEILIRKIQEFINPIFSQIDLVYSGLDIIIDNQDKMWLVELNSQPVFRKFIENNDKQIVVDMFKRILVNF